MKPVIPWAGLLLAVACSTPAHGHGAPIAVDAADGRLVVSGGLSDPNGSAPFIFVEPDEDADPFFEGVVPPFGLALFWQVPGFEINGMDEQSSISIEVLRLPEAGTNPPAEHTLWYWSKQTQLVEPTPTSAAIHLLAKGTQSRTLTPSDTAAPPPLLLSDAVARQQGFHNHGLLSYALGNDPSPGFGAFGFFARVVSDSYAPSDPFLIVFKVGDFDYEQMIPAARAINAAAIDAQPIPGDYDANDQVDAADYAFWREQFGKAATPFTAPDGNGNGMVDAADYVVWRNNFSYGDITDVPANVPEPGALGLAVAGGMVIILTHLRRFTLMSYLRRCPCNRCLPRRP